MKKIMIFVMALTLILIVTSYTIADSITLTPDKILRVNFYVPHPLNPVPDTFKLSLGMIVANKCTSISGSLYNGDILLGTDTYRDFGYTGSISLSPALNWISPDSAYTLNDPAIIDFSSIRNGSINGRLDFTVSTGSMTIDLARVSLYMIDATVYNGGYVTSPDPVITSKNMIPEPASLLLLCLGSSLMGMKKKKNFEF